MKIMAMLAMAAVAVTEMAMTARAESNVTIYMNDGVNTCGAANHARKMTTQAFAAAGVQIEWRTGRPSGAQADAQREGGTAIIVSLATDTPADYLPGVMASAKAYEGVHITVYWDRIAGHVRPAPPAMVLANVLIHEITHILQGIDRHSESGVMKARWTYEDYRSMARNPLPFTTHDVELIQLGLARRSPSTSGATSGAILLAAK